MKPIIDYFLGHLLEIATLALVIVTFFYMLFTRQMAISIGRQTKTLETQANILRDEHEARVRLLLFSSINFLKEDNYLFLDIWAANEGHYPASLESISINILNKDKTHAHKISRDFHAFLKENGGKISEFYKFNLDNLPKHAGTDTRDMYINYAFVFKDHENKERTYALDANKYIRIGDIKAFPSLLKSISHFI